MGKLWILRQVLATGLEGEDGLPFYRGRKARATLGRRERGGSSLSHKALEGSLRISRKGRVSEDLMSRPPPGLPWPPAGATRRRPRRQRPPAISSEVEVGSNLRRAQTEQKGNVAAVTMEKQGAGDAGKEREGMVQPLLAPCSPGGYRSTQVGILQAGARAMNRWGRGYPERRTRRGPEGWTRCPLGGPCAGTEPERKEILRRSVTPGKLVTGVPSSGLRLRPRDAGNG